MDRRHDDGAGHPFGEDFLNFWSAARLAVSDQLYVSDYDCVMIGLAALWLWNEADGRLRGPMVLAVLMPLFAAPIALASGIAVGAVTLWPLLLGGCIFPRGATRGLRQA